MSSPINEFVKNYIESGRVRFHMPGHKGRRFHGLEGYDITEIRGADYLFEAGGIIAESEANAAELFGTAKTLYSTEGSSLCIKTMLGIIDKCRMSRDRRMLVLAPRNVHKAFINGCILLDIDVCWVYPREKSISLCAGAVTAEDIRKAIASCEVKPDCVYITSPDYLGNISDIKGISEVCKGEGIPLLCDNAHGAYLNFLEESMHPMALGADMCCDSAHKTLPCYTGTALLHISKDAPEEYAVCAKNVMSLFASTSPSYLLMQSLDLCMDYISKDYRNELTDTVERTALCKKRLQAMGWSLTGDEPCKITVNACNGGLSGDELGDRLREHNIEPEYTDDVYVVLMVTPFNTDDDFKALESAMETIEQNSGRTFAFDEIPRTKAVMPIRQAAFAQSEEVDIDLAEGRICAMTVTSCQPSVPVAVSGEVISSEVISLLKRYGIKKINVVC